MCLTSSYGIIKMGGKSVPPETCLYLMLASDYMNSCGGSAFSLPQTPGRDSYRNGRGVLG